MNAAAIPARASRRTSWTQAYAWCLFYVMPFADAATGYLVLSGNFAEAAAGSISQLLRAALMIPALLLIKGRAIYAAMLPIFYVLIFESVMLIRHQHLEWFVVGTVYGFKLAYLAVSYLALRDKSRRPEHRVDVATYFIHGASLYGLILVLSTVAGLSTPTYGEGNFGSKGLFASGNGLALYLGCAALLSLVRAEPNQGWRASWESLFLLMCCLLVGTKASLICAVIFIAIRLQRASLPSKFLALGAVTTGILLLAKPISTAFGILFDVILYRFETSESLFSFLASGRDLYVADALGRFDLSGWSVLRLIFGAGAFVSFRDLDAALTEYDTLESDFFDIFFAYGLLGLICYGGIILWGILLSIRGRQYSLLVVWGCTCLYSAMAGHVAFNAMSGMAIPVFLIAMQRAKGADAKAYA
jgi:O-antigen ligase like membrane protein